ncbi:MAG: hypothetical protein HYZ45_01195 [Burkholderiales bacterium]|nr:hypothetical protein [Burkholderiales bacterium]
MKEADIIHDAYASNLKASYAVFSASYIEAGGDQQLQHEAEDRFRIALANAKKVKERALAVVLGL